MSDISLTVVKQHLFEKKERKKESKEEKPDTTILIQSMNLRLRCRSTILKQQLFWIPKQFPL